ncbi:hypothetical protein BOTCAL_0116g00110 [Botryotinia calthae]|uniref:Uncharacterized protein n=1 Tax=Botryotinia calthae TaxID=38488 RepID=A0A4Y8D4Z3_9HELO|nr:hypothetical protein BOTCAL_0116g00110 [Botryotinia calthae]
MKDKNISYEKSQEFGSKSDDYIVAIEVDGEFDWIVDCSQEDTSSRKFKCFLVKRHQNLMSSMVGIDGFDPNATVWEIWRKAEEVLSNSQAHMRFYIYWSMDKHHIKQTNSKAKESTEQLNLQNENSDSINPQPVISSGNAQNNNFSSSR